MFSPLYSRSKFAKRLDSLAKTVTEDMLSAAGKIREHITSKLVILSEAPPPLCFTAITAEADPHPLHVRAYFGALEMKIQS